MPCRSAAGRDWRSSRPASSSRPSSLPAPRTQRRSPRDRALRRRPGKPTPHPEAGPPETAPPSIALPLTCIFAALILAVTALAWSLTAAPTTVAELAALLLAFAAASAPARNPLASLTLTAAALASATGLAFAAPIAAGWPAGQAALAAVAVAAIAIVLASWPLRNRPAQGLVLDVGAAAAALTAAIVAARAGAASFALVAALSALLASGAAWLRDGQRRTAAFVAAGVAGLAAVLAQSRPLVAAWFTPQARPWHGYPLIGAESEHGLPFAVAVLTMVLASAITASGAWRSQRRSSLDALAVALPVIVVPAALASGFGYVPVLVGLLVLAVALTGWAAFTGSFAPASGAIVATLLTLDWALAARTPTLIALGCLTAAYGLCVWRVPSPRPAGRSVCASLTVLSAAGFTAAAVLAAGGSPGQVGLSVLAVAAAGLLAAARLSGQFALLPGAAVARLQSARP